MAEFRGRTVLIGVDDMDVFKASVFLSNVCLQRSLLSITILFCHNIVVYASIKHLFFCNLVHQSFSEISVQGIDLKLAAFEQVLQQHPEWRGKLVLIQVTSAPRAPGRDVEELHRYCLERVAAINDEYRYDEAMQSCKVADRMK